MPSLLKLSWPPAELHSNNRAHWAKKSRATKAYRQEAWTVATEAGLHIATPDPNARLEFTFYPPDRRHRDLHNMPAAMKAAIDGIADAMGCDDNRFRCIWPDKFEEPTKGGAVLVFVGEKE